MHLIKSLIIKLMNPGKRNIPIFSAYIDTEGYWPRNNNNYYPKQNSIANIGIRNIISTVCLCNVLEKIDFD